MEVPFPELELTHRSLLTITLSKAPVLGMYVSEVGASWRSNSQNMTLTLIHS